MASQSMNYTRERSTATTTTPGDVVRSITKLRDPTDPTVVDLLAQGLVPLYRLFLDDYAARLQEYGEPDTARLSKHGVTASISGWRRTNSCKK